MKKERKHTMKNILGVYSKEYPTKILLQEKNLDTLEKLSQILKYRSHVYFTKHLVLHNRSDLCIN